MDVAVTGGTGFLGRYIVGDLIESGHSCRCWYRPESDRGGFEEFERKIRWLPGSLSDESSMVELVNGVDAIVHAAFDRPTRRFRGAEGDIPTFVERNVLGTVRLIDAARSAGVKRFVFISTCAVHEVILNDRALDEAHPLWPTSHYGAHKAAIEKFIHSYGLGDGFDVCCLRPTGIYGLARPASASKWYELIQRVKRGEAIGSQLGGKEVHAADVARAVGILLKAEGTAGQAYNCYDMYIAEQTVAEIAKKICGSDSVIEQIGKKPKNQIDTSKLCKLGMKFGGEKRLEETIHQLLEA